jgi:hypothetical protein
MLMELLVKDRDRLLVCSSGFVRWREVGKIEAARQDGFIMDRPSCLSQVEFNCREYGFKLIASEKQAVSIEINIERTLFEKFNI